jgi:hypothetical protein
MSYKTLTRKRFAELDEAVAHARTLRAAGYRSAGRWSLGQACEHLARFTTFSLDGFPGRGLPVALQWLLRTTLMNDFVLSRPMPRRMPTLGSLVPPAEVVDADAVDAFAAACRRFDEHYAAAGSFAPEPLLGRIPPQRWKQIHLLHASHHLSLLVPGDDPASGES